MKKLRFHRWVSAALALLLALSMLPAFAAEGEKHTCTWVNGEYVTEPTCDKGGEIKQICSVCGSTRVRPVDATGHTWVDGEYVTEPTCDKGGAVNQTCSVCGSTRVHPVAAAGHTWVDGEYETEPTCVENGAVNQTCSVCGSTRKYPVSALGHSAGAAVRENEVPADYGKEGSYDLVTYCTVCQEELQRKSETIPALVYPYYPPVIPVTPTQPTQPTTPVSELPFTDVSRDDMFYEAVKYVYEQGLMVGTLDTAFSPSGTFTRAQVATILFRMENSPETAYAAAFTDVLDGQWHAQAITWGSASGLLKGYDDGSFRPDKAVTLEQLLTILYRYAGNKGWDTALQGDITGYACSDYAADAVSWAVASGLIDSGSALLLREPAVRWQVAVVLARFCQTVVK